MQKERLWKVEEAAEYLGYNRHTIYKKCRLWRRSKGRAGMEHEKLGVRGIRIPEHAVMAERRKV